MAVITSLLLTRHGEAHCNVAGVAGGEKACTGLTKRSLHVGCQPSRCLARA